MKDTCVIDANIILRYLLADHPGHFQKAKKFMNEVISGEVVAYITEGVIIECVYVLQKFYKVPKAEISDSLISILNYKGTITPHQIVLEKSLRLFKEKNMDIVDAIVFTTAKENGWSYFTFDKDFKKLEDKN